QGHGQPQDRIRNDPAQAHRPARGGRRGGGLSRLGESRLHHERDPAGRRRPDEFDGERDPQLNGGMAAAGNKSAAAPFFTRVFVSSVALWRRLVDRLRRLFGLPTLYEPPVTTQELKSLLQRGIDAGVFAPSEQDMVEAVFFLGKRSARSLMTPRTRIVWLDLAGPPGKIGRKMAGSGRARLPVAPETRDGTVGSVESKDLLAQALRGRRPDISSCLRQPLFVPRSVSALQVLELFKESGKHIALVVDEYGGIEGMLTHHDILEA